MSYEGYEVPAVVVAPIVLCYSLLQTQYVSTDNVFLEDLNVKTCTNHTRQLYMKCHSNCKSYGI